MYTGSTDTCQPTPSIHPALVESLGKLVAPWRYVYLSILRHSVKPDSHTNSQYAFNDFAIRQVAQLLGQKSDEALFANYSFVRGSASFHVASRASCQLAELPQRLRFEV
jgi:hypothetical protein